MVGRQFVALKVVGSNPTTHPLEVVTINTITFFQKKKIKKKNNLVFKTVLFCVWQGVSIFKNIFNYKLYKKVNNSHNEDLFRTNKQQMVPVNLSITQKKHNPKALISIHNRNLNTFSVGSVIKYFNVKQGKYVRRSLKGLKIFLNFLRSIFYKKYSYQKGWKYLVFSICGFDYNLISCKKSIKYFIQNEVFKKIYLLYNLKISFTKKKDKRIKSIKKRLKKKILKNFLKKSNVTNK